MTVFGKNDQLARNKFNHILSLIIVIIIIIILYITACTGVQLIPKTAHARACCYKLIICLQQKFLTNECTNTLLTLVSLHTPVSVQKSVIARWLVRNSAIAWKIAFSQLYKVYGTHNRHAIIIIIIIVIIHLYLLWAHEEIDDVTLELSEDGLDIVIKEVLDLALDDCVLIVSHVGEVDRVVKLGDGAQLILCKETDMITELS